MQTAPDPVAAAVAAVVRSDRGRLLSALIARLRDFHLAKKSLLKLLISKTMAACCLSCCPAIDGAAQLRLMCCEAQNK